LERKITKDILRNKLKSGQRPAMELLYSVYSGMLFSYVLQFIPDKAVAEQVLVNIFSRLTPRLQQACDSNLSIYSWLQVESRKIILEYIQARKIGPLSSVEHIHMDPGQVETGQQKADYFFLLRDASPEQQWVFRELFINGREKEELARETGKDLAHIGRLLRESLLIIRKKLG
jgi:DNA-directed RNA polymerase specialized sigma24 family protein